jgi:hypothetical protein
VTEPDTQADGVIRTSSSRWRVALAIETAKTVFGCSIHTDSEPVPISEVHRASSFGALALQVENLYHPFQAISPLAHADTIVKSIPGVGLISCHLSEPITKTLGSGTSWLWGEAKTALVAEGYMSTAVLFGAALLLNNSRRIILPWLGGYVYGHPVEELRIALSRPDLLIEENLSVPWATVIFIYGQRMVFDAAGSFLMTVLIRSHRQAVTQPRAKGLRSALALSRPMLDLQKLAFLLWTFATAEYLFCRLSHTVTLLIAYRKLLFHPSSPVLTPAGPSPARLALHLAELWCGILGGLLPLLHAALSRRGLGLAPLLAACAGVMWFIIRFRSLAFLPLETAGLFVALGHALVGGVALAVEFFRDPLRLRARTAVAFAELKEAAHASSASATLRSRGRLS